MSSLSTTMTTGPLHQLIDFGGPVMIVLLVLAVIGFATFLYTVMVGTLFAPRTTRAVRSAIDQWRARPSQDVSQSLNNRTGRLARWNPLVRLTADTMKARLANTSETQVREQAAQQAQRALQPFEAPLKIIEVIAALAPLLGLLGTVMGMMDAFNAMAATEGRANASQLSGGIYEALSTTAAGLVVAIPMAAIAAWLEFRLRRLNTGMNETLVAILRVPLATGTDNQNDDPDAAVSDQAVPSEARAIPEDQRFAHAAG
ncbi:outer membrane transport energization protein ExbB [Tamilnaduibacter salinus]|uniref:Flagellar motor protein MotA n=1 Tax=Tamilnaduibacter salinus TaxID=1484056 RepID=A0A2A2I0G5_9GAMM|nr:MotA/TolQ/ExbB proton channel family protein [Tamilnaduibacter salinus]PAV25137.1 flagellar motor protein MotA [Tamilnaduibacter salinus]PVY76775.1 outer membrane transport energization protein ExbB [Tamilnaduibacter salinus]